MTHTTGGRVQLVIRTFSASAEVEQARAKAGPVPTAGWHTEALVGRVFCGVLQHLHRHGKAERLDAFHLHVFHIAHMDGPEEEQAVLGAVYTKERKMLRITYYH